MTLHGLFETKTSKVYSSIAITFGNKKITYQELNDKANRLANHLVSLGAKPDMLVAICMERSIDLIVGLLAILKSGAAYLPIDLSYPQERLSFMLEDAKSPILITQKTLSEKIPQTNTRVILIDEFDFNKGNNTNPVTDANEDNLAYVIYTSGSTGKPNGVMVTHKNVIRLFQNTQPWFNFNEQDVWTFFHSYAFDFSVWEIWGALVYGGRLVVVPYDVSRSPEAFYELLLGQKVTVLNQTPSAFYQLIHTEVIKKDPTALKLRYIIFGGEALNMQALKPWFKIHNEEKIRLINMYGITETTVHVTYRQIRVKDLDSGSLIGVPIPDLKIYILDEQLNPVKTGEVGELYVAGDGLARGYLNRPELTASRFIEGLFIPGERLYKTGDLGKLISDGDIEYIGRKDHQVKIRGFRIELGEIENSIRNYPGIKNCAVKVHYYSDEVIKIIAYIVSEKAISAHNLKETLSLTLPEYMIPNSFVSLDKLPLTPNGKTDFKSLPVPAQKGGVKSPNNLTKTFDQAEAILLDLWKELLSIDNIEISDNFFDVGGNSLLMGRLQINVNKAFNENISIVDLFQYPTISALAKFITNRIDINANSDLTQSKKILSGNNDIAIIGIAGRYPKSKSIKEFWQNLIDGNEVISYFTDDELEFKPGKNSDSEIKFIKARGVLENVDQFDAEFFGFNPREAAIMDPQHRIFLECAWQALEDAGYCSEKYDGTVGIFAGSSLNTYLMYNVLQDRNAAEEMAGSYQIADYNTLTGNDNAFLTTKVAYKLGLKGPAVNVQTACSTSLVAVGQAYQSLITGQCDMALAGGVSITFPQKRGYFFVDGSIGSVDGHCRPFDADATGTVFSHGAGIVVLKRLEDAKRDGDSIYAVIKSVALNNDGAEKAGYMTPSVDGQSEVILKAQKLAGIDPKTIKYIETHGTGTPVGDPIEVAALEKAFKTSTSEKMFCGIGSVKSNIGHTDAAAGVTGLIKTVLSLYNRIIPPTIHYKNPNPRIDFASSPFYVVDKLTSLDGMQRPLRAAVSAFGVGGTNAHAIIEEFPHVSFSCEEDRDKYLLVVSGKTENTLNNNITALKNYFENNTAEAINDIAFTLQQGRKEFEWRQFIIADNTFNAIKEINKVISSNSNKGKVNINEKPQLVFMFPGQGAQYVNMGKGLYLGEQLFRNIVDSSAEYLKPYLELDIRDLIYPDQNSAVAAGKLEQTVFTQPALFIIEFATAKLLLSYGINPSFMIGHSVGDYVAACLSGVFSLEDALYIIAKRARLMQKQDPGSMLSVRLNKSDILEYIDDEISLAAVNSPNLVVLSGPTVKIKDLAEKLSAIEVENRVLYTSHAYHSKMMEPALKPFAAEFKNISLNKPSIPFISSLTGTWITDEQATDPEFWAKQLRNTVRFSDGITELQKNKNIVLVELGPGRALSTMAGQHRNQDIKQTIITTLIQPSEILDDKTNLLNAIGKMWLAGLKIDWNSFYKDKKRKRLHLPAYQFDRKSYWIEPPASKSKTDSDQQRNIPQNHLNKQARKAVKKVVQGSTMNRKEYIIQLLKAVLEDLSGIKKTELDESKSFLELGFDSLFMTQISLAFQKKFDVKITLRQLLETAPTIIAISEHIDSKLPEGKFEPPKQEVVAEEEDEAAIEQLEFQEISSTSESIEGTVERLIKEQLEIMRKQLEVLSKAGSKNKIFAGNENNSNALKPNADLLSSIGQEITSPVKEKKVFERFGPYKPIETKKIGVLTESQQKYLDTLIKSYVDKTSTSKKLTQEHRAHYSDPRTVSGFLPIWKEMTYQIITKKSEGSKLLDVDDNEYIDVIMGFGQYLFGHNPKFVRDAIVEQLKLGFEIGPQSPIAGEVAKLICEFTGFERAAFCVTGSEAVLGAMRAARTVTGKDKIVFFAGDYHGIIDEVLIKSTVIDGQVKTMPIAPGIPRENVQNTIALEYGSEESLRIIEKLLPEIAGIMVEPVQARRPDLQPKEFLQKLRKITEDAGIPLIFDEVITGFRSAQGGAQEWFDIKADIGTFGKVIGGGFPIGVIAGKKLYLDSFDGGYWQYGDHSIPEAGVTFFAGTFARHPLSLTACYSVLKYFKEMKGELQSALNKKAGALADELNEFLNQRNMPLRILNYSSVLYYSYPKDLNYFSLLFYVLRYKGIHILEGFPMFLSEAHSDQDIRKIINAFKESIIELQDNGFFPAPLNGGNGFNDSKDLRELKSNQFPLADAQKEIWIASKISLEASRAFNESASLKFVGKLNVEVLSKSINLLLERHSSLRTVFAKDGTHQFVKPNTDHKLKITDLSNLDLNEKQQKLKQRIDNETLEIFDLENGPLYRFELVKISDEEYYLIITAHHIICDGWSFDVMSQDLSSIYSKLISGHNSDSVTPMQMKQYVDYLEQIKTTDDYKSQVKFWLEKLGSINAAAELPVDNPRPAVRTFTGSRYTGTINYDLLNSLRELSKKNSSTFFTTMLSGFILLVNKLTGSKDIVTGIPAAGQQVVGAHDLVGHCTNLLPLRFIVEGEKTFLQLLSEARIIVLEAYENQQVSYGDIISKLKLQRDPGRIPLISTMFNIDPAIMGLKFADLSCEMTANPRTGYQFELGFNLVNHEQNCLVECDYNTALFSEQTIIKFIQYYIKVLEQVTRDPEIKIKDITILSSMDVSDLMNLINN